MAGARPAAPATRGPPGHPGHPGQDGVVNADGGQFAPESPQAAGPGRPDAADRHPEPDGGVGITAARRGHQAPEQSPILGRQPAKRHSYSRVPVPCHGLAFGRMITVQRAESVSLLDRKLPLAVPDDQEALPADGRSQPPADRAWLAQRADVLNQAQPRRLHDIATGRQVQPVRPGDPVHHPVVPANEFLPRLTLSGRYAAHEVCDRRRRLCLPELHPAGHPTHLDPGPGAWQRHHLSARHVRITAEQASRHDRPVAGACGKAAATTSEEITNSAGRLP